MTTRLRAREELSLTLGAHVEINLTILTILIATTPGAGCLGNLSPPAAVPPAIVPVEGGEPRPPPGLHLPFEDGKVVVRIDIDSAIYAGAKGADRRLRLYKDLSEEEWIPIYYQAFANDPHQESFYADLLAAFPRDQGPREGA